jgi:hypothetical protein
MRILINLNASESEANTLNELIGSGLPKKLDARLLVTRQAVPTAAKTEMEISQKENLAIREAFPDWRISSEISAEWSPSSILRLAKFLESDIILFSETPNQTAEDKNNVYSTANRLLAEAECSVRILKPNAFPENQRILVGFDGSPGAIRAVTSVAERKWPAGTEVRLLAVVDHSVLWAGTSNPETCPSAATSPFGNSIRTALRNLPLRKKT